MAAIQEALIRLDLLKGAADGAYGPATDGAIRQWQRSKGLAETGYLPEDQISTLQRDAMPRVEPADVATPVAFRCPAVGSVFVYQLISAAREKEQIGTRIALGGSGLSCSYLARGPAFGPYEETAMHSGFWRALTEAEVEAAKALDADRLWPAEPGKSISATLPAVEGMGRREIFARIERIETVHTPAGEFSAVVCSVRERATAGSGSADTTTTFWWAPSLGDVVKAVTRDAATGVEQGWQVSNVATPIQ